ncbi:MAG: hypothetical protein ACLP5H_30690, partial [Desulfomonilaceae bacterium]
MRQAGLNHHGKTAQLLRNSFSVILISFLDSIKNGSATWTFISLSSLGLPACGALQDKIDGRCKGTPPVVKFALFQQSSLEKLLKAPLQFL